MRGLKTALVLSLMAGSCLAQTLPPDATTAGTPGQPVAVTPIAIINPNNGTSCIVGNTGCPSIGGGGGGGGGAITAASGSYAAGALSSGAGVDGWNITEGLKADLCAVYTNTCSMNGRLAAMEKVLEDNTTPSPVKGSISQGTAATDPPVVAECRASTTLPTAQSDGTVVDMRCNKYGNPIVTPWAPPELWGDQTTTITSSTAATTCVTAPGAGVTRNIMSITIDDSAASDTIVQILNTDGTTVRWTGTAKANDMRGIVFPGPLKGSATAVDFKCKTVTSTNAVTFTIQYFDN